MANANDVTYQWLDCNKNAAEISRETNQQFLPDKNGSYAVVISDGTCKDTSACFEFELISVNNKTFRTLPKVYPNPGNGAITIEFNRVYQKMEIEVLDLSGKKLETHSYIDQDRVRMKIHQDNGFYLLKITADRHYLAMIPFIKLES